MRAAGMTAALAIYWLTGVVGAASLPPDDQYSPQQSPYERDAARGPRRLPNWLEYHRDPSAGLESPENKPGAASLGASDLSRDRKSRKEPTTRDLDFLSLAPGGWNAAGGVKDFTGPPHPDSEGLEILPASLEDPFEEEDTFQDQGPGSVEVYKLDLRRENSLLVPQAKRRQPTVASRTKSKVPKKAKGQEILWKLKPMEPSKTSLPAIFRQPPSVQQGKTIAGESKPVKAIKPPSVQGGKKATPQESVSSVEDNGKDEEVFADGGVPELQVGCEGLEASGRRRRSSGKEDGQEDGQEDDPPRFKDPVYRESTEPILLRVTPIVLDFEDEPPSGRIYEELDELLKLKSSTTPAPSKRANRGDIDPALENYGQEDTIEQTFPERGDLGTSSGKARVERSVRFEDAEVGKESPSHSGGRKLLWVENPEEHEDQVRRRHHRETSQRDPDLWGFGEDDGEKLNGDEDSLADSLRNIEVQKRLREWERRKQEDEERRRGGHGRRPHSRNEDASSEIERIRKEYDRQQEEEQRERQRIAEERMRQVNRRQWEEDQRRAEEVRRRQSEESRRRAEEEERRRNPSHSRGREEEERRREWNRRREEEERRIRLEAERRNETPPSPLTRPSTNQADNRSRSEEEERKLREYMERNRPIDVKRIENRTRTMEEEERRRQFEAQRRRQMEEERRRQMEEQRRRGRPDDDRAREEERRRQMEEQRRRDRPDDDRAREEERRRQMEEQRRRDRPDDDRAREEERRRQLEEQRRRDRPDDDRAREDERRRQMEELRRREEERRRQMEEQRRRDRPDDDRAREEERRRQMEEQRRRNRPDDDRAREEERRRQMEEHRLRARPDADRAREEERRRRLEEERKLQEYVRRNQPVNLPRKNQSQESDWQEQRRTLNEARQWERNRDNMVRPKDDRSHGPSAPTDVGQRRTPGDVAEARRRQEAERLREAERRRFLEEGRRREEQHRREESRRHEEERRRLEAARLREEAQRRRTNLHVARRPTNSSHGGNEAGALRRHHQTTQRVPSGSRRIQEDEWRRRSEERQRQQQAARERMRIEHERNSSRNNGRRRPQPGDTGLNKHHGQRGESVRRNQAAEEERRRREEARLKALPVSARIIVRSDGATSPTLPPPQPPPDVSIGTRAGFGNEIDFPAINPNRRGLEAARFPAPPTPRPPARSPSACVWAIVNCCPANNRVATCFESMGCPGANWDPSPCRASIQSSAQAEVLSFFESAQDKNQYTRQ